MGKPNILFILSDDQGSYTLGSYGNEEAITPNLDSLANEGMQFENFYCTSPVCSPARASILTGKMPSQHGIYDWLGGGSVNKEEYKDLPINHKRSLPYLMNKPENPEEISENETIPFSETESYQFFMPYEKGPIQFMDEHLTYTEILKQNGYTCGLSGKWHLGDSKTAQKGFDYWEVIARGGTNYMLPEYIRDGKIVLEEEYVTDIITNDAIKFIEQQSAEQPFYLSVHYTAPHDPWDQQDQPEDIWNLYNNCEFNQIPQEIKHKDQVKWSFFPKDKAERDYALQGYFTTLTAMDQSIGKLVESLKKQDLWENTVLFFMADNGFNLGHHGIWGKGNGTLPLNLFETSVKVPCIVVGPGVEKGQISKTLVSQYDVFPTILELAQCDTKNLVDYLATLPGSSMVPLLSNDKEKIREKVVIFDEYGPARMIRQDDFKLIYRYPYGPHELYDLKNDPTEVSNLYYLPQYLDIRNKLNKELFDWFDEFGTGKYDASRLPINGSGQMGHIDQMFDSNQVVFVDK
ncbi:sulfatase-like hydrolase/transferase [Enterococcus sp.]|uniref:sulfatase-like hydrolase/transferase n=1 Tax=Enterococcus sp. TaxID=35783 RepID=UPI002FC8AA5B